MDKNNIEESLLLQYFEGNINQSQAEIVELWINASEHNAKLAKDIYQIYQASNILDAMQNTDAEKALTDINIRIRKKYWRKTFLKLQKVAAFAFLPLMGAVLYFMLHTDPVKAIEVKATHGAVANFELPDGTLVTLNSGSKLKYPEQFEGGIRNVILSGEAFFDVKKSEKRFIVESLDGVKVEALGTAFNVESFEHDNFIAVSLFKGSIISMNYLNSQHKKEQILLSPGEKVVYDKNSHDSKVSSGKIMTDIAWKDGKIVLQNTSLEEVLRLLNKRFDVEFIIKNDRIKEEHFTGTFETQFLPQILEHLRLASGIRYIIVNKKTTPDGSTEKQKIELY